MAEASPPKRLCSSRSSSFKSGNPRSVVHLSSRSERQTSATIKSSASCLSSSASLLSSSSSRGGARSTPRSLLDLCAQRVAEWIPFERIDQRCPRIPEPVQERIVFWSFPRDEHHIRMYSAMASANQGGSAFEKGLKLVEHKCVGDVLQVGFHLSGEVSPLRSSTDPLDHVHKVSISFDRCKITCVTCSCDVRDIFWCQHVVALAIFRIRNANRVKLRVPISETLLQMDREQLQKMVQYLISEHHKDILPTAQKLADEILNNRSEISRISGAPDPTAGSDATEANVWHLDEQQIREQVRGYLAQGGYFNAGKHLTAMFAKVREMLKARDSNGARMLTIMTEEFLADPRLLLWKSQNTPMTDKCRQLWDQLGALWVTIVLNPLNHSSHKRIFQSHLERWSKMDICPLEDPDYHAQKLRIRQQRSRREGGDSNRAENDLSDDDENSYQTLNPQRSKPHTRQNGPTTSKRPRTVFHKALDAITMDWNSHRLMRLITSDQGIAKKELWTEHLPTAVARVEALKSHGFFSEAVRLGVAVVLNLKQKQLEQKERWIKSQTEIISDEESHKETLFNEGWIGHPLNPIGCLFDTLTEACLADEDRSRLPHHLDSTSSLPTYIGGESNSPGTCIPLKYRHIALPGSTGDTYLSLAVQAALIGLGTQRLMPSGLYAQDKACKQEDRLIGRLYEIEIDSKIAATIIKQVNILLEMGPASALGLGIHPETIPVPTFAKFLFLSLYPHNADLAYAVGLRAMRMPIMDKISFPFNTADISSQSSQGVQNAPVVAASGSIPTHRFPRWFTLGHIETQQEILASTMLITAKGDMLRLQSVLECAQRHMHSSTHLFRLAQDALRHAIPQALKEARNGPATAQPPPQPPPPPPTQPPPNPPPFAQPLLSNSRSKAVSPSSGQRHLPLLNVAFQLGLRVVRMTVSSLNYRRREIVRWLVTCASELGAEALLSIIHNWHALFTPIEATSMVAVTVMSHATLTRLSLSYTQQEELSNCVRTLALQCAHEDPANCSLNALTLCESEPIAFETAYQIVVDSAESTMTSSQLFTIARYMEHRGYPQRGFKLALLAMKNVQVGFNQDTHPAINDIYWSCALSHSLGKTEMEAFIPFVVKNVHCATVLADILKRCSLAPPGVADGKSSGNKVVNRYEQSPALMSLLEAAMAAFVTTTHSRLSNISPRHYTEFIDFLMKARETFLLSSDGRVKFGHLLDTMMLAYKGKKKLISLLKERFRL